MMKRLIAWSLGLMLLMTSMAFAEPTAWICSVCGMTCKPVQNFCVNDGQPAPWVWTCSECGAKKNTEDMCKDCGKPHKKTDTQNDQENLLDEAFLMFADANWVNQYWGGEAIEGVTATNATIKGAGDYTVSLEFARPAEGLTFTALGIMNGELTYPGYCLRINEIRVNGKPIAVDKGYTSSDDEVCTRMNIYNEWAGVLPENARSYDHKLEDASWIIVDKAESASVSKIEVYFSLLAYR